MTKLNKRQCKNCGEVFQKKRPLQMTCGYACALEYANEQKQKKAKKEWSERKKELKPKLYAKKYRNQLQSEINKLARNIDAYFNLPCIDCGKPYTGQIDGAHFHNVGGNEHLRYNLHNIHSARAHCNQYDSEHKKRYPEGLRKRYGKYYLEYVEYELRNEYKELKLTEQEIYEKLKLVRKINRNFNTYSLTSPIAARTYFNIIIGIY